LTILKNTHFFPEKNSSSCKFAPFVSRAKVPGERFFGFLVSLWLMCTPIANAQPWKSWKVPDTLGADGWQVNLSQGIVLLSSSHSNWLYAYSSGGELLWKRSMSWPLSAPPQLLDGLLFIQQEGQPALLMQPETGELRQRMAREFAGWVVPGDSSTWLRLSSDGQLLMGSPDWNKWKLLTQLTLERGDHWWGPPVRSGSSIYVGTALGQLQRVDLPSGKIRRLPTLKHPLQAPQPYPKGVLKVSSDGLLTMLGESSTWVQRFVGGRNCYSRSGRVLARPSLDEDGNVYLATRTGIVAWDSSGKLRWKREQECGSPIHWHQHNCYLLDDSPALLRISPFTGEVLARSPLPARPSSDLALEKQIVALTLSNGQLLLGDLQGNQKSDTGANAATKVGQFKFFVGAMNGVVRAAKTHQHGGQPQ
jgi:hypothetical protein